MGLGSSFVNRTGGSYLINLLLDGEVAPKYTEGVRPAAGYGVPELTFQSNGLEQWPWKMAPFYVDLGASPPFVWSLRYDL